MLVVDEADHVFESDFSKIFFNKFINKFIKNDNLKMIFTSATITDNFI